MNEAGAVSFEIHDGRQDLDALLADGFRLEGRPWKLAAGSAILSHPSTTRFYTAVARWAAERDMLRLAVLRLDGQPIAFSYNLQDGGRLYGVKLGMDDDYGKLGPGTVLTRRLVEYAFGQPELTQLDLLGQNDGHKADISSGTREQVRLQLFPAGWRGQLQREAVVRADRAALHVGRADVPGPPREALGGPQQTDPLSSFGAPGADAPEPPPRTFCTWRGRSNMRARYTRCARAVVHMRRWVWTGGVGSGRRVRRVADVELHTRPALLAAGYSDRELRRLRRTGELNQVRRGSYLRGQPPDDAALRHLLAARAALDHLAGGVACSHVTAAVLHGLPVWRIPLQRVHVTRIRSASRNGSRTNARVHVHATPLTTDEVVMVAGTPVTSLARTAVDLARSLPFEEAVAVLDAVLHGKRDGPATEPRTPVVGPLDGPASGHPAPLRPATRCEPLDPAELATVLEMAAGCPGVPAARRAIAFADGRSASVGESRSRVAIRRAGLPEPVLQWSVLGADGRLIGMVDFGWPERRTVGEFDGRVKYGALLRPGQDPGDAVFEEKRREDRLRDQGLAVVRWTWPDLADFAMTATRLRSRLTR